MVAMPLTLPMGRKNLLLLFCTAIENISYMANALLQAITCAQPHNLSNRAEAVANPPPLPCAPTWPLYSGTLN